MPSGIRERTYRTGNSRPATTQSPIASQYQTYNNAVNNDTSLYNTLLQQYQGLLSDSNATNYIPEEYTPQTYNYTPSADYTNAISQLQGLANTGGYSEGDLQALRERGVSPIRAVYAGANRDINRRASITGNSASFGALKAKLAREQSQQMAESLNNVNAGIAENVAQGKRQGIMGYANAAGQENAIRNQYGAQNAEAQNRASQFNVENRNQAKLYGPDQRMKILNALQSLYSQTPGRSALYGNQAQNAASLQNNIRQVNRQYGLNLFDRLYSGLR